MKDKNYKWTEKDFQPKKKTSIIWEGVAIIVLYILPLSLCCLLVNFLSGLIRSL